MPNQAAKAIPSLLVSNLIKEFSSKENITLEDYIRTYRKWIEAGPHNIVGLKDYTSVSFIHGTIQCFDHFYLKYSNKRFRIQRGEFMYHRASLRNMNWEYLDSPLEKGDALIISCPFSDTGKTPENLDMILKQCDQLEIPVLLDLAYLPLSKGTNINVEYKCIDSICTSLSKAFDGAQYLRTGIRFQKCNLDDGIDIFNSVNMIPKYDIEVAHFLMKNFPIDYLWKKFGKEYSELCKKFELEETDCIIFGITKSEKYKAFNRGNDWNRVCLADDLGEI